MIRRLAISVAISALGATSLLAQPAAPKPAPKTDSTSARFVGNWEGSVFSDHAGESVMLLTVATKPALKLTLSVTSNGQAFPIGDASNIKFDGNSISWSQPIMDQECKGQGVLIDGALKGELACPGMTATFLAQKK